MARMNWILCGLVVLLMAATVLVLACASEPSPPNVTSAKLTSVDYQTEGEPNMAVLFFDTGEVLAFRLETLLRKAPEVVIGKYYQVIWKQGTRNGDHITLLRLESISVIECP